MSNPNVAATNLLDNLSALVPMTHVHPTQRAAERARREALYAATVTELQGVNDALAAGFGWAIGYAKDLARHMEWLEWELDTLCA